MDIQQILKVLKNERECIARQSRPLGEKPQCRKDDDGVKLCEYCDLCLPDDEILSVYDFLIGGYESLLSPDEKATFSLKLDTSKLSQEEYQRLIDKLQGAKVQSVSAIGIDIYGKDHFKGICPYINKPCDTWTCGACEVERRERKFAEGDTE